MKRLLVVLGVYLAAAIAGKVAERLGAVSCDCDDDCWCRRPALSVFRWVFPRAHDCR